MSASSVYPPVEVFEISGPPGKQDQLKFLIRPILSIDLYLYMIGRSFVALFYMVKAWFTVLLTGKYPEDSFKYLVDVLRFNTQVQAYFAGLVGTKPSSALGDDPSAEVRLQVQYTPEIGNVRAILNPLLGFVLMIAFIPGLILGYLGFIVGWLTTLFTGSYPAWAYEKTARFFQWQLRVSVFYLVMTEVQPEIEFV
jgi:hypothetical protein